MAANMDLNIVLAQNEDLAIITDFIYDSELGENYYPTKERLYEQIKEGMEYGDKICAAKDIDGSILGIVWYQLCGMFHVFPYLHMIVVRRDLRQQGIGAELMDFFEYDALISGYNRLRTKVFLTVGDFNVKAQKIYLSRGYMQIGEIDGLYRKRTTEKIYMRIVTASDFDKTNR